MLAPIDIEAEAVGVLNSVTGVPFSTRFPNPRPETFGRVSSAGTGIAKNFLQSQPRLLIECWAPDEPAAFALTRQAASALADHYGLSGVWGGRASLTWPVNFPDPDVGPRYQFFATILTNLTEATP